MDDETWFSRFKRRLRRNAPICSGVHQQPVPLTPGKTSPGNLKPQEEPRMKIGTNGLALIKHFEELRLKSYICPAGKWTIGWGHTGDDVTKGRTITEAEAELLLQSDLSWAEDDINSLVKVPLSQNQFDALVCLDFNIGTGNFESSTLLKKLNQRDYFEARMQFSRWVYANKVKLKGLERRRLAEANLFNTKDGVNYEIV